MIEEYLYQWMQLHGGSPELWGKHDAARRIPNAQFPEVWQEGWDMDVLDGTIERRHPNFPRGS